MFSVLQAVETLKKMLIGVSTFLLQDRFCSSFLEEHKHFFRRGNATPVLLGCLTFYSEQDF